MKKLVIYKSKTGYTEKYAKWIAAETDSEIFRLKDIDIDIVRDYDVIVYCGGLYAGGILGFSFIKKNFEKLKNKKVIVVAVGATIKKEEAKQEVKNKNLLPCMENQVEFFLLRGGLNYKRMCFFDKVLMFLLLQSKKTKNKEKLDEESKGLIATYGKTVDFTDKNSIKPILKLMKE